MNRKEKDRKEKPPDWFQCQSSVRQVLEPHLHRPLILVVLEYARDVRFLDSLLHSFIFEDGHGVTQEAVLTLCILDTKTPEAPGFLSEADITDAEALRMLQPGVVEAGASAHMVLASISSPFFDTSMDENSTVQICHSLDGWVFPFIRNADANGTPMGDPTGTVAFDPKSISFRQRMAYADAVRRALSFVVVLCERWTEAYHHACREGMMIFFDGTASLDDEAASAFETCDAISSWVLEKPRDPISFGWWRQALVLKRAVHSCTLALVQEIHLGSRCWLRTDQHLHYCLRLWLKSSCAREVIYNYAYNMSAYLRRHSQAPARVREIGHELELSMLSTKAVEHQDAPSLQQQCIWLGRFVNPLEGPRFSGTGASTATKSALFDLLVKVKNSSSTYNMSAINDYIASLPPDETRLLEADGLCSKTPNTH